MAPLDFKHMTSADYKPGEDDAVKYYAQKRKKQYHGNESKDIDELSMKKDKELPNLKIPVKGKKGTSKYMRMKINKVNAPYTSDYKKAMNASVQSADRKPEKFVKPDGKVGIRMVKTDKEVIKKESMQVFRVGHKTMSGNVHAKDHDDAMAKLRKKGVKGDIKLTHRGSVKSMPKAKKVEQTEASVLKPTKPTDIIKHAKTLAKNPRDYMMNKKKYLDKARAKVFRMYPREEVEEAINHDDAHRDAQTHSDGSMSVKKIPSMIKKPGDKHLHLHMKSYHKEKDGQDFAKKHGYKVKNYVKTPSGTRMDIHKEEVNEEADVDEALNLQQRMKRSRLMKRLKTRIKIGRQRAMRKMANKKTLEKRSMRQARAQIAKKLTRGIPKGELTFARKKEIEKRLEKPALQQRIKRMAKRLFKDVRKKEVQRKKG